VVREFAVVPVLVITVFAVLAVLSILADQTHVPVVDGVRTALGHVVGDKAASASLQAVATGLVTVTSITFSVLLLAVQQTASNLSPVVFDQFMRRRSNQVYLGFFVGLALYAYVVMACVQDDTPPIIGAAVATLLTGAALAILLLLVYSTVDQMRPSNVLVHIRDRVLAAREHELGIVRRTRREGTSRQPERATCRAQASGYVTGVLLGPLESALAQVPDSEVVLAVRLGDHVAVGDPLATLHAPDDADTGPLVAAVGDAVVVDVQRDLDHDPATGIDELANIGWTSGSTSKQNPEVAWQALNSLTELAACWLSQDHAGQDDEPLRVVYRDTTVDHLAEVFFGLLVVAHESHQVTAAARVLGAYRGLVARAPQPLRARLVRDLRTAAPLLDQLPVAPVLERARRELEDQIGELQYR
jgi:uncharacterized membrane protein